MKSFIFDRLITAVNRVAELSVCRKNFNANFYSIVLMVLTVQSLGFWTAPAQAEDPTRISNASGGVIGNGNSYYPRISKDGRYVVFMSAASNLVNNDTNGKVDVFLYDRNTQQIELISVATDGTQGNNDSAYPSINADGRYVLFASNASNLALGDTNGSADCYLRDRLTGQTTRVSVSSSGQEGNGHSCYTNEMVIRANADISDDGRYIVFTSTSSNFADDDLNGYEDVFLRDLTAGTTTRVSVTSAGGSGNNISHYPAISGDGKYAVFESIANNLTPDDTNASSDIFVREILTGMTTLVSKTPGGSSGNGDSRRPAINSDGRYIAFGSYASDLVSGDANSAEDVFVWNRTSGSSQLVSRASDGTQGNDSSGFPHISGDGRYVVYRSDASNLVPSDTNNFFDIFVSDVILGQTSRLSVKGSGAQSNADAYFPYTDGDGSHVAWYSADTALYPGDSSSRYDIFLAAHDACPDDSAKLVPGVCGCGSADTDSDVDGSADCVDACAADPSKAAEGVCGCGVSDADLNTNGAADCLDPTAVTKPSAPVLKKRRGGRVRVTLQAFAGQVRYRIYARAKIGDQVVTKSKRVTSITATVAGLTPGRWTVWYTVGVGRVISKRSYSKRVKF